MADLERIANNPEWQPSSKEPALRKNIKDIIAEPMPTLRRFKEIWLEVWQLKNGLLYGVVKDERGRNIIANRSYESKERESAEEEAEPTGNYVLWNITKKQMQEMHGFLTTFLYRSGPAPDGFPAAKLEYTTWHAPGSLGDLTMLTSVYAFQHLPTRKLGLIIDSDSWSLERARQMKINVSGDAEGELKFDKSGKLQSVPQRDLYALMQPNHHLNGIYLQTSQGREIDVLGTSVAMIHGFPNSRPLDIRQLIKYK